MVGFDELLDKSVMGTWGNHVGDVLDVDIDPSTWNVTHLLVKLSKLASKEIGVKNAFKTPIMRIPTSFIDRVGVIITLNQSIFDLKENQDYSIIPAQKQNRLNIKNNK